MSEKIYSVFDLNKKVKQVLEQEENLKRIFIKGEMSNITYYKSSGHLYFTLKDAKASVKSVAFKYKYKKIPEDLKEGDNVKVFGSVSLYEASGSYQLNVLHIERLDSTGNLYEKMEKLKKELMLKGYFDEDKKKKLPFLPLNIGVVSSLQGAAIRDIINTAKNRYENVNIYAYNARVQGEGSELEIKEGIEVLNKLDNIDLIIVGRGGGSIEDLWSFNKEEVINAIIKSKKPIVSAVGHEIDFLISDFVADKRAATPTQAAEIVLPEKKSLKELLKLKENKLKVLLRKNLEIKKLELKQRTDNYILKNIASFFDDKRMFLSEKEERLNKAILKTIEDKKNNLSLKLESLKALNPKNVLKRGYSVTMLGNKVIRSSSDVKEGDILRTILEDGEIKAKVL